MKAIIHYADGTSAVVGTDGTWLQSQATSWIVSSPSPLARRLGRWLHRED